jgi:CO/xanthine dehydrogenase Mo-binding subunit
MINNINIPVEKVDNQEKIAGNAIYLGDMQPEGMLFAKTLRSDRPRAIIKAVDIPPLPEGYFIVDKHDVPGKNRVKIIFDDQPFFAEDTVNYIGEPILLVVGPDKQRILELISDIRVHYEDIDPVLTLMDAENNQLQPIFGDTNYFAEYCFSR